MSISEHKKIVRNNFLCRKSIGFSCISKIPTNEGEFFDYIKEVRQKW